MTGTTTGWQIPYATGTDRLCDGYAIIDSMAERIDALLADFNADLERVQVIPYASISTTVNQTFSTNLPVAGTPSVVILYDTVNADTNSYTNLATLPSILTLPVTGGNGGFFAMFLNVLGETGVPVNTGYINPYIAVNSTLPDPAGAQWSDNSSFTAGGTVPKMMATSPATGGALQMFSEMQAPNSTVATATMLDATFLFFWVADQ